MIPRTSKLIASFVLRWEKRRASKLCALDLGCGSGYIGKELSINGFNVDCADYDKNIIFYAKQHMQANINFYASDLFDSIPPKKYDIITFDIPFFPEKKSSVRGIFGNIIAFFHLENSILPLLRKAFPDKNRKRKYFIERIAKESRDFLKPKGKLFLDIFKDEFVVVSKYLRIDKKEEMFQNHFIICASLKRRY
jgi:methylase of polypeptide subunit release factors